MTEYSFYFNTPPHHSAFRVLVKAELSPLFHQHHSELTIQTCIIIRCHMTKCWRKLPSVPAGWPKPLNGHCMRCRRGKSISWSCVSIRSCSSIDGTRMYWSLSTPVTLLLVVYCVTIVHWFGIQFVQPWPVCPGNDNRLLSLFNFLCNATQTMSITTRDACYGCFFRAGSLVAGPAQLSAISQCATLYLLNSSYAICATNLAVRLSGR